VSNDNVTKLIQPGVFNDQLTEILRMGHVPCWPRRSRPMVADFLGEHADLKTEDVTSAWSATVTCRSAR